MPFLNDTMNSQEELAALLARNLTLAPTAVPTPAPAHAAPEFEPKIVYSISQHYHHSAHAAKPLPPPPTAGVSLDVGQHPVQRPASEPPQAEYRAAGEVLAAHGVDPSALSRAQLELFKTVDDAAKAYLVRLWRLSPPTNSRDNPTLTWASTTVEQEEALVHLRLQAAGEEAGGDGGAAMSLDGTPVPTPMQAGDGRWLYATSYMEPYMESGYASAQQQQQQLQQQQQQQQQRQAVDPVYRTTNAGVLPDWATKQQETMENNYGLVMAMRENMEL